MNQHSKVFTLVPSSIAVQVCLGDSLPALATRSGSPRANLHADKTLGNWAATADGDPHFSFGVPEDVTGFVGARVLVIGSLKGPITYDLNPSLAKKGQLQNFFTNSVLDQAN